MCIRKLLRASIQGETKVRSHVDVTVTRSDAILR